MANTKKISQLTETDGILVGDLIPITRGTDTLVFSNNDEFVVQYEEGVSGLIVSADSARTSIYSPNGNTGIEVTDEGIELYTDSYGISLTGASGLFTENLATSSITPTGSDDATGVTGAISWDDDYIYVKTSAGWARAALTLMDPTP